MSAAWPLPSVGAGRCGGIGGGLGTAAARPGGVFKPGLTDSAPVPPGRRRGGAAPSGLRPVCDVRRPASLALAPANRAPPTGDGVERLDGVCWLDVSARAARKPFAPRHGRDRLRWRSRRSFPRAAALLGRLAPRGAANGRARASRSSTARYMAACRPADGGEPSRPMQDDRRRQPGAGSAQARFRYCIAHRVAPCGSCRTQKRPTSGISCGGRSTLPPSASAWWATASASSTVT